MLRSPRKNGLDSLFKEVRAFKEGHITPKHGLKAHDVGTLESLCKSCRVFTSFLEVPPKTYAILILTISRTAAA